MGTHSFIPWHCQSAQQTTATGCAHNFEYSDHADPRHATETVPSFQSTVPLQLPGVRETKPEHGRCVFCFNGNSAAMRIGITTNTEFPTCPPDATDAREQKAHSENAVRLIGLHRRSQLRKEREMNHCETSNQPS